MSKAAKLDQLTSLRFFAAAMIVIYHSAHPFGFNSTNQPTVFGAGVSFFFVLSGFILAYVYPTLGSLKEVRRFLLARVICIWPAHAVTFLFAFWLLSLEWETPQAIANLTLVHAWIPAPIYYFSYNAPSWSISTEWFFYLAFPFLICRWAATWRWKVLTSVLLLLGMMTYFTSFAGNYEAWLYISPFSRILEFLIGAAIALAYRRTKDTVSWGYRQSTAFELAAVVLCATGLYLKVLLSSSMVERSLGPAFAQWFDGSGLFPCFAVLIYVVALGRGGLSRLLSFPGLVILGEISFSIYLVHQIYIRYYRSLLPYLPDISAFLAFGIFWVAVILSSYILWVVVEKPVRQIVLEPRKFFSHDNGSFVRWRSRST